MIGLNALAMLLLSGCGHLSAAPASDALQRYDASTGAGTAVVANARRYRLDPECRVALDQGLYREVVIDAGATVLTVECRRISGVFGVHYEPLGRATVAFHAKAGARYLVKVREDFGFPHVEVTAASDKSRVIHRSLLGPQLTASAGATHVTLVARTGNGVIPCKFGQPWASRSATAVRRPARSFVHEPYSHQIIAECSTYAYVTGYIKERYEAPVNFVPQPGRLYTVHMDRDDPGFVFVTDVSSEARTIAYMRAIRTY